MIMRGARQAAMSMAIIVTACSVSSRAQMVQEVKRSWEKRLAGMPPLVYDIETTMTEVRYYDDERGKIIRHSEPRTSKGRGQVLVEDGRFARRITGTNWDQASQSQVPRFTWLAFDKARSKSLFEGAAVPFGEITPINAVDLEISPFLFAHAPALWLKLRGGNVDQMRIVDSNSFQNDIACIELEVPRASEKSAFIVYVDPQREYVPIRHASKMAGRITTSTDIAYGPDKVVNWVVDFASMQQLTDDGELESTMSWRVRHYTVNDASADELYDVVFPVGTHVHELRDGTESHYEVLSDGRTREILPNMFGRKR
jgi:hypothetical protein